jgi:hypothetical protein
VIADQSHTIIYELGPISNRISWLPILVNLAEISANGTYKMNLNSKVPINLNTERLIWCLMVLCALTSQIKSHAELVDSHTVLVSDRQTLQT